MSNLSDAPSAPPPRRPLALAALTLFLMVMGGSTALGAGLAVLTGHAPIHGAGPRIGLGLVTGTTAAFLFLGRPWARWILVALMVLNGVMSLFVRRPIVAALLSFTIAAYLVLSEQVEAFCHRPPAAKRGAGAADEP